MRRGAAAFTTTPSVSRIRFSIIIGAAEIKPDRGPRPPRLFAALLALIALILTGGGWSLVSLGGSPYYLVAGIVLYGSAALLWQGSIWGSRVYGMMLAGTVIWALYEAGLDGWALMPRIVAPAALGVWLVMPWTRRQLRDVRPVPSNAWRWILGASGLGIAVIAALVMANSEPAPKIQAPPAPPGAIAAALRAADGDWVHYGNALGGTRFSPLAQITPANVDALAVAWTYHLGAQPDAVKRALEVTPIKIGDSLYVCDALNNVIALDAETGQLRWRYDAHTDRNWALHPVCRGVSYFHVPAASGACAERIMTNTQDARLIALDAHTGQPCAGFGERGSVSLLTGLGDVEPGYYEPTSAPTIVRGKIVVGGLVLDNQRWGEPSGVIRAFDAGSGKLAWAFDLGRPGLHGEPPPGGEYTRATPNVWAPMSGDETLGLVYAPTGNATPDYFGAQRRGFDDQYSSAIVALDAETGDVRWKFQTVHHDLWDYDVSSQPTLIDIPHEGKVLHALVQATKQGQIFVLDRATGQALFPVQEQPAPQAGAVPEERVAATQPLSVGMPFLGGARLTEADMWGLTPLDQLWCRIKFRAARYEGMFTPPGLQASIAYPGVLGGVDWGGIAVDPERALMIVNANNVANYNRLLPRAAADALGVKPWRKGPISSETLAGAQTSAQANTPYAASISPFLSPLGVPCQQPPFSTLSLVDLKTGRLVWSRPLGTAQDSGPFGLRSHLPFSLGAPVNAPQMPQKTVVTSAKSRPAWRLNTVSKMGS